MERPNVVLVVSDTLRTAELGCYGCDWVKTPNIDAFAEKAVRFTRAFPESLPTIPVRRALHTGRRAYPFHDYRPVKWDIVYLPGWQPMDNDEDTLAENLAAAGWETGFVTDTLPYFAPGFNFTRGFWQWEFIRGQQNDRWKSTHIVSEEALAPYVRPFPGDGFHDIVRMHLANTARFEGAGDTCTAKVFRRAMEFIEDNSGAEPFYLLVDCFDPHEPWDAPREYFELYGDPDYRGRRITNCRYGPIDEFGYTQAEVENARHHYAGLVTLVDEWFGRLTAKLDALGLADNTVVILTSDHGTNFCDNPRRVLGKPGNALYPGVMRLPLLIRMPGGAPGSTVRDEIVYNHDITATIYDIAGIESGDGIDGQSLAPLLTGTGRWRRREYVTCRYDRGVCYIDDRTWALGSVTGEPREVFDLESDPDCMTSILENGGRERWKKAWERLLADAGGTIPDYDIKGKTDAVGHKT